MASAGRPAHTSDWLSRIGSHRGILKSILTVALVLTVLAILPAVAGVAGLGLCETGAATTLETILGLLLFGGPLVGGFIGIETTIFLLLVPPTNGRWRVKRVRNRAIAQGVIVAPLGAAVIGDSQNHVLTYGASCGF